MPRPKRSFEDSFQLHALRGDGCWPWGGIIQVNGYGVITQGRQRMYAHRWSYEYHREPIPPGHVIDHLCRNRSCVNPDHLEAVTDEENLRRGAGYALRNGMRSSCVNGHEYTPENTYTPPDGRIRCRQCARDRDRARAPRRKGRNKKNV